ncbi:hypothetical protein ROS1_57900 [Roseibium sp. ROS1]
MMHLTNSLSVVEFPEIAGDTPLPTKQARRATRLAQCRVIRSSGCHRYGYWNEQFLFDGRTDTGWCTPSRKNRQREFLEIDLATEKAITKMRLLSRSINKNAGLPEHITILVPDAVGWKSVIALKVGEQDLSSWYEWPLPHISGPTIRLEFDGVGIRPEGKYFLQFMALEFYA